MTPRASLPLRTVAIAAAIAAAMAGGATSAALAASGDSVSGQSYNLSSGNAFTITFTNNGGAAQLYDYVQVPSGVNVTAGTFTSGASGTFTPGGGGSANTGEWHFSGSGLPVGTTFTGTFTTDASFACGSGRNARAHPRGMSFAAGVAIFLFLNSTSNPASYTMKSVPYHGMCATAPPPAGVHDLVTGFEYDYYIDRSKPSRPLIDTFGGLLQNPSMTAPSNPATISLDPMSTGTGWSLDSFMGLGITGTAPTFKAPALPPGGQLKWTAATSLKLTLPSPGHYGDYRFNLNVDQAKGYDYEVLLDSPLARFYKTGSNFTPHAARAAASRPAHVLAGTFASSLPAGRTNALAPGYADPNRVVKVQVAVVRAPAKRGARSARAGGCLYYQGPGRFKAGPPGPGGCTALIWRDAKIVAHSNQWYYGFNPAKPLPPGSYTAFVRAITHAGAGDPSITDQYRASPYRHVFACRPGKC